MSLIGSLPSVTLLTSLLAGFRVRTFLYVVKAEWARFSHSIAGAKIVWKSLPVVN